MLEMNGSVFDSCIQGQSYVSVVYRVWLHLVKRKKIFSLQSHISKCVWIVLKKWVDKMTTDFTFSFLLFPKYAKGKH